MRIDQLLVERGLASTRSQAQRLIASGVRWMDRGAWRVVKKNGDDVPDAAEIELLDDAEARYVSRGGLKLEGALLKTGIEVTGKKCLDIGQSTGGFTDCLLKRGAAHVVGVDVGQAQLHPSLRDREQVTVLEGVNARNLTEEDVGRDFDFVTGDLSFISLTLVLPALAPLMADGAELLMLVKPQFELQPGQVGKHGIVKDPVHYAFIEQRIRTACSDLGLAVKGWHESAIQGGDGNREFFIHASKERAA